MSANKESRGESRGKVQKWLDRVVGFDGDAGASVAWPRRFLQLSVLVAREFRKNLCWERAATLGFTTIISLLPIGFLSLSLFSLSFDTDKDFQDYVANTVLPFFLPEGGNKEPPNAGPDDGPRPVQQPTESEPGPVTEPEAGTREATGLIPVFQSWIRDNVSLDELKTQVSGNILALVALVVSALALLVSAERVFNGIWNVARARHYFQKFVAFWVILTTSPVLIAFSFEIHDVDIRLYGFVMPTVISCTAFTLLYLFLPNTRVRFLPGLAGGCFAGLVWEGLKIGFYVYFDHAIRMSAFYGALALLPIFLIFIYVSWLIVLAGTEIAYCVQHFDQLRFQQAVSQKHGRYSYSYLALAYLERVATAFGRGTEVPDIHEVARDLETDPQGLQPVVDCLVGTGVLVENAAAEGQFYPARDPEQVALRDVVETLIVENSSHRESQLLEGPEVEGPAVAGASPSRAIQVRALRSYLGCFDGKTLADLECPEDPVPEPWGEAQISPESGR